MTPFIDGALMMGFFVAGLCMLRFWRKTRDRFFIYFSLSFWILGVNRIFLAILTPERGTPDEEHVVLYMVRLLAFAILLVAIIEKNRKPRVAAKREFGEGDSR